MGDFFGLIVISPFIMVVFWTGYFFAMLLGSCVLGIVISVFWPPEFGWRFFMIFAVPILFLWASCCAFVLFHGTGIGC